MMTEPLNVGRPIGLVVAIDDPANILGILYEWSLTGERETAWFDAPLDFDTATEKDCHDGNPIDPAQG
jgi:hypothetical protein